MNPKVSVITTAYNHEKTLPRAIQSVMEQKKVSFEHIIIDDTKRQYGMMLTFLEGFERAKGQYIAFCDGDDFWIDELKLFKQAEYMDAHPECGLCLHKVMTKDEVNPVPGTMPAAEYVNSVLDYDHILRGSAYIFAQSYMLRRSTFEQFVNFKVFINEDFALWDLPIVLQLSRFTKFHCLDFYGAVYTKNSESATNTRSRSKRLMYILNQYQIKLYFIRKYGCSTATKFYLGYRFLRHLASILLKRWK